MGIGIWQLVILLVIVLLLFGTKRLRNLGGDLGAAIKGFRSAVKDGEEKPQDTLEDRPKDKQNG
ncbi:MAG: twin-arginine translocase TatA/TatE family subunit [Methylococcaceae bacterium]